MFVIIDAMKRIAREYSEFVRHPQWMISFLQAAGLLLISLIVNYFASHYAFVRKDNPVTDILLDNLPVVNMDIPFTIGTVVFLIFIIFFILSQPKRIPFILKAIALFVIIRSTFVVMTHIGPSPLNTLTTPSDIGKAFTSGADLFFSGHTGMPFLFSLMYWHNPRLRNFFIAISILAAAGVLLGHIHYSIDVASAYFITHGIFLIAQRWFKKDWLKFESVTN
jgi:hypothetical protein